MADQPDLVASHFTLSGAGFAGPARNGFADRCEAAAAAGFSGVGLPVDDLPRSVVLGLDIRGMRRVLDDTGLRLVEIEFLGGWALPPDDAALSATLDGVEAVADALGGRHVSAGEFRGRGDGAIDKAAAGARLRRIADRLAARGLLVAVEAFPWSALPTVDTALDLVRRAGAPNAGLMIDVWHFYNGGADAQQLEGLRAGEIAAVQLNDGPLVHDDFLRHARAERRLPGEGALDVVALIRGVRRAGFDGPFCVEVDTPELRALPADEAARRACDAARAVLAAADAA